MYCGDGLTERNYQCGAICSED